MTAANSQVKEERKARDGRLDKGGWRLMEKRADEQSHSLGYCSINTKQPLPSRDQDFVGKYGKLFKTRNPVHILVSNNFEFLLPKAYSKRCTFINHIRFKPRPNGRGGEGPLGFVLKYKISVTLFDGGSRFEISRKFDFG